MSDEKKLDPFKPVDPSIPGVAPGGAKRPPAQPPRTPAPQHRGTSQLLIWVATAAVVVFIVGGAIFFWLRGLSAKPGPSSVESASSTPAAIDAPKPAANLPVGPGPIATAEELSKTWSTKRFLYKDPVTSEPVPAMVVHLPGGSYWAFSLRAPFGNCQLEFVSDLDKLQTDYNYRADHPMVGDPCNHTVFDLLRYGTSSNGGLVRGEVAQGSDIRPPMAIEVRIEGSQVIAARME